MSTRGAWFCGHRCSVRLANTLLHHGITTMPELRSVVEGGHLQRWLGIGPKTLAGRKPWRIDDETVERAIQARAA